MQNPPQTMMAVKTFRFRRYAMNRVYIGIDPGLSGAMGVISPHGTFAIPFDEEEYVTTLNSCIDEKYAIRAVVEHVGAMPKQGVASTFKFGANFGWIQGVLFALGIPYELVRPQKWKKEFSCTSDKNTSVAVARRLFPSVSLLATPRCKKPHDGMAEALLMAEYAKRKDNL